MDILRTWFGSGLVYLTLPLVILGMLFPWKPERNEQNWMIVAILSVPWLPTWLLCQFTYHLGLAFVCLLFTGLLFVALGRVLRMIVSEIRR